MKKHFITFSNKNYMSTKRIIESAKKFNLFDTINALNEIDIEEYYKKHINFIKSNPTGFGLFIWKPKIIYDTLLKIDENDIIIYCDAGCYLNIKGIKRLKEYFLMLQNNKYIITFGTSSEYQSKKFVKMDAIMNYYPEFNNKFDIASYAGLMIIKKNKESLQLIKEWLELCENYNYLNPNHSIYYKEAPYFVGNDLDNGLFNLCLSKHQNIVEQILPDETNLYIGKKQIAHCGNYKNIIKNLDWSSLDNYPFHLRRYTPKFGFY